MVAPHEVGVVFLVVQGEREYAVQVFEKTRAFFLIERQDDFAVGLRLEAVPVRVSPANVLVVVDFAVDREDDAAVCGRERLLARKRVDNREPLSRLEQCLCPALDSASVPP